MKTNLTWYFDRQVAVVHNCFLINLKRVETGALSFLAATRDDAETEVLPFGAETHLHRSQKRHSEFSGYWYVPPSTKKLD